MPCSNTQGCSHDYPLTPGQALDWMLAHRSQPIADSCGREWKIDHHGMVAMRMHCHGGAWLYDVSPGSLGEGRYRIVEGRPWRECSRDEALANKSASEWAWMKPDGSRSKWFSDWEVYGGGAEFFRTRAPVSECQHRHRCPGCGGHDVVQRDCEGGLICRSCGCCFQVLRGWHE